MIIEIDSPVILLGKDCWGAYYFVANEYYWFGNGNVGYYIDGERHIVLNINEVKHIKYCVPYTTEPLNINDYKKELIEL